jgi:transposase
VAALHLLVDTVKGHRYGRIAQKVCVEGRWRRVTVFQLGRVTDQQIANVRAWLERSPLLPPVPTRALAEFAAIRKRHTWLYGRVAVGHLLWRKLGLHRIVLDALNGIPGKGRVVQFIEAVVLNRLDDPTSKYGLLEWLPTSATPFLVGFAGRPLHENLFYRSMDALWRRKDRLEARVYEQVVRPLTHGPSVLYHDLTSSYFEGTGGDLGRFGYSRDHRPDRPQVSWGMVVTPEGFPITMQVYPGNTKDETTVQGMRKRLESVFGIRGGLYVGDRGLRTAEIVKDLQAQGFHYILAERTSHAVAQEALALAARKKPIAVSDTNEVREAVTKEGIRHIVLLNPERRTRELETLVRRKAEGQAILKRWRKRVGKDDHHAILKGAQRELAQAGLSDLFELDFDEDSFQGLTTEWKGKVDRVRQWAGWWVLSTDTELPAEEVARLYQGLAVIERGWRELKGVLEVRPLRHRLERRVEAHLQLCVLAYLVEKYLEEKVRSLGFTGAAALDQFRASTLDELEWGTTGATRWAVTEPTKEQEAILRAADLSVERFREGWRSLT